MTKTDLAKYLTAWEQKPDIVSLGSQKNFDRSWAGLEEVEGREMPPPDAAAYKHMIAKAIIFKTTHKLVRPMFPPFQANVSAYVVSILAHRLGGQA